MAQKRASKPAGKTSVSKKKVVLSRKPKLGSLKVIDSKKIYSGPIFSIVQDHVVEPNGVQTKRDVVRHPGSVVVLAIDDSERTPRVLLEKQYRYAAGKFMYELPAGRIDPGEKKLAAAKRELIEETGYRARKWEFAFRFWASPGFVDESMDLFLAQQLRLGDAEPEEDEKIELSLVPLPQAVRMIMEGTIDDGKTMAAIFWYAEKLRTSKRR